MDVLWGNCSVICGMYERGKEVIQEWLWQPGLSRAPRLAFQTRMWEICFYQVLCHDFSYVITSLRETKSQQNSKMCNSLRSPPPLIDTKSTGDTHPSVSRLGFELLLYLLQFHCTRGLQYPKQSDRRLTGSSLLSGLNTKDLTEMCHKDHLFGGTLCLSQSKRNFEIRRWDCLTK